MPYSSHAASNASSVFFTSLRICFSLRPACWFLPATATATPTPVLATPTNLPSTAGKPGTVSFSKDVLPILTSICVKCHGGEKTEQSLVLKTYADVMKGSDNGPVIEPGKLADNLLTDLINQGKMPKKGPRLLPGQIRIITQRVDEGAPNN